MRTFVPLTVYSNGNCTGGSASGFYETIVYAPAGFSHEALCTEATGSEVNDPTSLGGDVYRCLGIV